MTVIAATSTTTSRRLWEGCGCGDCALIISRHCTSGCCIHTTAAHRSPRRPCTRSTLVIRGALADAVRRRLVTRNVALVAHAPRLRSIPRVEQQSWTAAELQAFLRASAGHRLCPAFWVSAFTGMRRNELLGLRWTDFDERKATISINRGLVAVGYELHEHRGKTPRARRQIDLDPTTLTVINA